MQDVRQITDFDVIVVGAGNAGLAAALSARDAGARTLLLEAASEEERGGNSRFSGGMYRFAHDGPADVAKMVTEHAWEDRIDFNPYPKQQYVDDVMELSRGKADIDLVTTLVEESHSTVEWLRDHGLQSQWIVAKTRDLDKIPTDEIVVLRDGSPMISLDYGVGMVQNLFDAVEKSGAEIWYSSPAHELIQAGDTIRGVRVRLANGFVDVHGAVVLACGGFEASPELRLRYLGEGWDLVKVRGTRYNMGNMLVKALDAGAQASGHWGGAHAVPIDADAPEVGDLALTDHSARYSYTYGVMVNLDGERFLDEGEDEFRKTYAKAGAAIRGQREGFAVQIFDQKVLHLLEPRYDTGVPVVSETIEGLADELGIHRTRLARTIEDFNAACPDGEFRPFVNDGLATSGVEITKSNWSLPIDEPPYVAYKVRCGITFTYGGLKVDTSAQVISAEGSPMTNLYATGEIIGGVFFHNYPAGAGLMLGAVYGRIAGRAAARAALSA